MKRKWSKIVYGGDYNPEQWPREIRDQDMRLFKLADIDIVTLNVFSWALNQPRSAIAHRIPNWRHRPNCLNRRPMSNPPVPARAKAPGW